MNVPLNAAAGLMPMAMPRWRAGKASVSMAEELAMEHGRADALEDPQDDQPDPGDRAGHPRHGQQ